MITQPALCETDLYSCFHQTRKILGQDKIWCVRKTIFMGRFSARSNKTFCFFFKLFKNTYFLKLPTDFGLSHAPSSSWRPRNDTEDLFLCKPNLQELDTSLALTCRDLLTDDLISKRLSKGALSYGNSHSLADRQTQCKCILDSTAFSAVLLSSIGPKQPYKLSKLDHLEDKLFFLWPVTILYLLLVSEMCFNTFPEWTFKILLGHLKHLFSFHDMDS